MKQFNPQEFDRICHLERERIVALPYNDQYTQQFTYCGRTYFFDPDFNCFYPHREWSELNHWDRWGWIYTILVLGLMCWFTSN